MVVGVIAPPELTCEFDGRVYIERVCETKVLKVSVRHTCFSMDVFVVEAMRSHVWHKFVQDGMYIRDLIEDICSIYDLDEHILK